MILLPVFLCNFIYSLYLNISFNFNLSLNYNNPNPNPNPNPNLNLNLLNLLNLEFLIHKYIMKLFYYNTF